VAAFQETIVSARTPFDDFRDALARRRRSDGRYPAARCAACSCSSGAAMQLLPHGPAFTNGEFGDIGIPFFVRRKSRFGT
jgi:cytochrome c peroxidase